MMSTWRFVDLAGTFRAADLRSGAAAKPPRWSQKGGVAHCHSLCFALPVHSVGFTEGALLQFPALSVSDNSRIKLYILQHLNISLNTFRLSPAHQ
jgi:hypothetical protein